MTTTITYDDKSVRRFMIASIFWGIVGMLVGVLIATQLSWWQMNGHFLEWITGGAIKADGISFLTFGRLRPLHTNAVIFAFVGNMMFAGIYYSTQRLCKARTASDLLSTIHFWGWQLIIVAAAITLPAGFTRGKEYAELIWPINIAVVLIWVVFAVNFFWTLAKRNEPSLYVALWFYIATIITVAMLYIVNHLSLPTSLTHSYPIFGGLQDGLVQWWYGHNAVAFFLTTPILGIMYYFLPKAANRPVYSYRLSIVHFWSLVFIYIWAGPHHLLNTALPRWLQMLGMLFSLMLWAPSWGGMLNGLLTLRGAWDKLRTDPVIKFFAAGVTFYGMATFEGPLLAITRGQRALPLHRLDRRPRPLRRPRLERLHGRRHVLLARPAPLENPALVEGPRQHALLDRPGRHPALRRRPVVRRHHAGPHARRSRPGRHHPQIRVPGNPRKHPDLLHPPFHRRHALPHRLHPLRRQHLENRPLRQGP